MTVGDGVTGTAVGGVVVGLVVGDNVVGVAEGATIGATVVGATTGDGVGAGTGALWHGRRHKLSLPQTAFGLQHPYVEQPQR